MIHWGFDLFSNFIPIKFASKKKKKVGLLLARRGYVICQGHLRSLVAALCCSLCQKGWWNLCAPHHGLC